MASSIKFTKEYSHSIDKVWRALTDAEAMSIWLMPCNFKAEVGYEFQFQTKPYPGFDGIVNCKVLELIHQERLSFTWSGGGLQDTIVTFQLQAVEDKTLLNFEHSGFEGFVNSVIVRRILASGWKHKILTQFLPKYLDR